MSLIRASKRMATKAQIEYLKDLFDRCGYTDSSRRVWLHQEFDVRFTDELTLEQASKLIEYLKLEVAKKED